MPIISFEQVDKVYKLRRESYRALSSEISQLIRKSCDALMGHQQKLEPFYALKDASFEINPGETVGILGPNGSGKTTILRLIANITKPTSGKVRVTGRIAPLIEIGAGFHPELTGRENVYLNGVILGMSKQEVAKRFDEIVAFAELEKFIDSPIKQYSSGMYVRLGFSVAVHSNFDILLADEILAVGDQHFRDKCMVKFEEIKRAQKTILIVSHSLEQLKKHCSRGILIRNGKISFDGPIEEACHSYAAL